ncbi:Protein of unknown function [Tistlia consotensis]|uniref:DUF1203 domain-containing protein n=1 Tax=Tistlia consotensis USBA 355 TaxID=560819 RepID=A0A1Y6BB18_9PROT|nr:DUF1203 domain-containing protein [Tistlia consotensis]SMF02064.1 Protein of unknown function [Tistlia consotensis USBA 355]SNS26287.1 Protein of unknown function [Tistlia consotensis]
MSYRITGLSPAPFRPLFGLSEAALAAEGARRVVADEKPGFPDRIELRDAEPGEALLLVNYLHQPAGTPYRSSHAVFVLEGATETYDRIGEVPAPLLARTLSLRAFDAGHMMIDADLVEGAALEPLIERFLADPKTAYLHAHYARRGCYAARIERA